MSTSSRPPRQDRADRPHQDHPAAGDRHRLGDPCPGWRQGIGRQCSDRARPHRDPGRAQAGGAGPDRKPARCRAAVGAARQFRASCASRDIEEPAGASEVESRGRARPCWRRPPSSRRSLPRSSSRSPRSTPRRNRCTAAIAKIDATLPLLEETADHPPQGDGYPVRQPHRLDRRPDPPDRPAERTHRAGTQAGRDRGRAPGAGAAARPDQVRLRAPGAERSLRCPEEGRRVRPGLHQGAAEDRRAAAARADRRHGAAARDAHRRRRGVAGAAVDDDRAARTAASRSRR